jgi:hypothetical protein
MKTKRIFGVLFLVVALVITQLPVPTVEAVNSSSDFQMQGTTLVKYLGDDLDVVIPDGVKTIGSEAFSDCDFIKTFSLPNSVITIEDMAFSGCTGITVFTLPDTTESLGTFAFYNCENLKTMYFGDELKTLGEGVFLGCKSLEKVIISDLNTNFKRDEGLVYSMDEKTLHFLCAGNEMKTYTMPSTVTEIDKYAFWGCDNLENVFFSTSMDEIPEYAFMNCTSLKEVTFPLNITSIDMKAFAYCTGLKNVTVPMSVKYIHPTAFDSCINIELSDNSGAYAKEFFEENKSRIYPEPIYELEENIEEKPEESESENNPEEVEVDESDVFGSTHIVGGNAMVILKTEDDTIVTGYNNLVERIYGSDWKEEFITDDVVNHAAFYGAEELTAISLPDTITKIDDFAFARSGLTQINIPEQITEIGYASFYHSDSLQDVTIPDSVNRIGAYAFDHTPWMETFYAQGETDYLIVGDGVLIAYKGNAEHIELPEETKVIAPYAFLNHTEITRISGGENITHVDPDAFYGCNVNITQSANEVEINNSINQNYVVTTVEHTITNTRYLYAKWGAVFGLLLIGIVFLSFKTKRK